MTPDLNAPFELAASRMDGHDCRAFAARARAVIRMLESTESAPMYEANGRGTEGYRNPHGERGWSIFLDHESFEAGPPDAETSPVDQMASGAVFAVNVAENSYSVGRFVLEVKDVPDMPRPVDMRTFAIALLTPLADAADRAADLLLGIDARPEHDAVGEAKSTVRRIASILLETLPGISESGSPSIDATLPNPFQMPDLDLNWEETDGTITYAKPCRILAEHTARELRSTMRIVSSKTIDGYTEYAISPMMVSARIPTSPMDPIERLRLAADHPDLRPVLDGNVHPLDRGTST